MLLPRAGPAAPPCEALQRSSKPRRAAGSSRLAAAHHRATLNAYGEPPPPLLCPELTASACLLLSPGSRPERRLSLSKHHRAVVATRAKLRRRTACVRHAASACPTRVLGRACVHRLHELPCSTGRGLATLLRRTSLNPLSVFTLSPTKSAKRRNTKADMIGVQCIASLACPPCPPPTLPATPAPMSAMAYAVTFKIINITQQHKSS
jgi:hypothetical protein